MRSLLALATVALLASVAAAEEEPTFDPADPATWPPAAEAGCLDAAHAGWGAAEAGQAVAPPWVGVGGLDGVPAAFDPGCALGAELASFGTDMGGRLLEPVLQWLVRVLGL